MLLTSSSEDDVNVGLREAISRLCKKGIKFNSELAITGLLAITIDGQEVFLVNIHEVIADEAKGAIALNDVASCSSQNGMSSKKRNLTKESLTSDQLQFSQTSENDVSLNKSIDDDSLSKSMDDDDLNISIDNHARSPTVFRRHRTSEHSRPRKSSCSNLALGQPASERRALENRLCEKQLCLSEQRLSGKRLSFDVSSERPLSRNSTRSNSPVDLVLPTPFCVKLEPTDQVSDDAFLRAQQPYDQVRYDTTQQYDYSEFVQYAGIPHSKLSWSDDAWPCVRSPYHRQRRSLLSSSKISSTETQSVDASADTGINASLATYGVC